jgi:protein CsiD
MFKEEKQPCYTLMIGSIVMIYINDPIGRQNFTWGSPKSKNVDYKVEHPVFFQLMKKANLNISYIDQFPEPKNMDQGNFLQRLI